MKVRWFFGALFWGLWMYALVLTAFHGTHPLIGGVCAWGAGVFAGVRHIIVKYRRAHDTT